MVVLVTFVAPRAGATAQCPEHFVRVQRLRPESAGRRRRRAFGFWELREIEEVFEADHGGTGGVDCSFIFSACLLLSILIIYYYTTH